MYHKQVHCLIKELEADDLMLVGKVAATKYIYAPSSMVVSLFLINTR
ncbi:hypothetical protein GCM10028868_30730 [Virgibacillus kimchii]